MLRDGGCWVLHGPCGRTMQQPRGAGRKKGVGVGAVAGDVLRCTRTGRFVGAARHGMQQPLPLLLTRLSPWYTGRAAMCG